RVCAATQVSVADVSGCPLWSRTTKHAPVLRWSKAAGAMCRLEKILPDLSYDLCVIGDYRGYIFSCRSFYDNLAYHPGLKVSRDKAGIFKLATSGELPIAGHRNLMPTAVSRLDRCVPSLETFSLTQHVSGSQHASPTRIHDTHYLR